MRAHRSRRSPLHSIVAAAAGAALIAVACTAPTPATADSAAATGSAPAKDERPDQPLSEFQVDAPVTPRTMTPPVYPAELRRRGVEGELIVQFVVDTGGRVQMDTFEAVRSPDAAFTDAVRTALATAEFEPAVAGGRAVRQLVQMPFVFALSR